MDERYFHLNDLPYQSSMSISERDGRFHLIVSQGPLDWDDYPRQQASVDLTPAQIEMIAAWILRENDE